MSPYFFSDSYAYENYVCSDGYAGGDSHAYYYDHVGYSKGARPVLNLSSEILKNGDGTMDNPFHPWNKRIINTREVEFIIVFKF